MGWSFPLRWDLRLLQIGQVDPGHAPAMGTQRLEISRGLSRKECPERVRLARDRHVFPRGFDHLEEDPGVRPTLVELSGRV
jgi:hypothetical protein